MNKLADVYAKTTDGWVLIYKDIPEDIALGIWCAGFKTGQNNLSIDCAEDTEFFKRQLEALHKALHNR